MLQSLKASGSVYFLELNISKPHIIAVILQSDIAGLIGCKLFHSCEFAVGHHLIPLFGSNLILENRLSILEMNNSAPVDQNLCLDRKSTRLNSSHLAISYAVFCFTK